MIGRQAGMAERYSDSAANKNSGLTWDEATFTTHIKSLQGVVKA